MNVTLRKMIYNAERYKAGEAPPPSLHVHDAETGGGLMFTKGQIVPVRDGDWIVTPAVGEPEVLSPAEFALKYEEAP
jgi:hypothetical protein